MIRPSISLVIISCLTACVLLAPVDDFESNTDYETDDTFGGSKEIQEILEDSAESLIESEMQTSPVENDMAKRRFNMKKIFCNMNCKDRVVKTCTMVRCNCSGFFMARTCNDMCKSCQYSKVKDDCDCDKIG